MKRLTDFRHELDEWREEKQRVGSKEYGNSDRKRYGFVDGMEELLDFQNIVFNRTVKRWEYDLNERYPDREELQEAVDLIKQSYGWSELKQCIRRAQQLLIILDAMLPDELATDENGGERVYVGNMGEEE